MNNHTLIDRYVFEVGNHLPSANRDDVQLELRSALHDILEARGLDAERPQDQEQIAAILKEFGHPEKVAASYRPDAYLISPKLFPIYELVVKVVWGVMTGLFVFGFIVGVFQGGNVWQAILNSFGNYLQTLFYTFGVITLVFYILQRTGAIDEADVNEDGDWDPLKLPEVNDPDRIKRGELIAGAVFTAIALVVFNAFLDRIGIPVLRNGQPDFIAAFSQDFKTFVPMLSVVWAADLALKITVLNKGRWQAWTRIAEAVISALGIYVLYRVTTEATILAFAPLNLLTKGALWIALVVASFDLFGKIFRLVVPGRRVPWQRLKSDAR